MIFTLLGLLFLKKIHNNIKFLLASLKSLDNSDNFFCNTLQGACYVLSITAYIKIVQKAPCDPENSSESPQ
jgi:hypothetical protein